MGHATKKDMHGFLFPIFFLKTFFFLPLRFFSKSPFYCLLVPYLWFRPAYRAFEKNVKMDFRQLIFQFLFAA